VSNAAKLLGHNTCYKCTIWCHLTQHATVQHDAELPYFKNICGIHGRQVEGGEPKAAVDDSACCRGMSIASYDAACMTVFLAVHGEKECVQQVMMQ